MIRDEDNRPDDDVIEADFGSFEDLTVENASAPSSNVEPQDAGTAAPMVNAQNEEQADQLPVPAQPQPQEQAAQTGTELKTYNGDLATIDGEGLTDGEPKGRIGDRLVDMGIITEDQLNVALQEKKISGKLLGEVLVDLGFIDEDTLSAFLAESSGFELFDALPQTSADSTLASPGTTFPGGTAHSYHLCVHAV